MYKLLVVSFLLLLTAACGPFASDAPTASPTRPPAIPTVPPAIPTTAASQPPAAASTPAAGSTAVATPASGAPADAVRIVFVNDSEARYRVREQLAGVSLPSDAVGATKAISGQIVAKPDGTLIADQSKITVDVSTLKSNDNRRDNFLRMGTLQTAQFPTATFVPTSAKGLNVPIKDGPLSFQLIGDLTVRNVTKQVTWDVTGTVQNGEARGTAATSFTFAYFNLPKPNVPLVLSVEDTIKLELDLHLKRG